MWYVDPQWYGIQGIERGLLSDLVCTARLSFEIYGSTLASPLQEFLLFLLDLTNSRVTS
jgi:hypothetical protein